MHLDVHLSFASVNTSSGDGVPYIIFMYNNNSYILQTPHWLHHTGLNLPCIPTNLAYQGFMFMSEIRVSSDIGSYNCPKHRA